MSLRWCYWTEEHFTTCRFGLFDVWLMLSLRLFYTFTHQHILQNTADCSHTYLNGMKDTECAACWLDYCTQEHDLCPDVILTRNYAPNHTTSWCCLWTFGGFMVLGNNKLLNWAGNDRTCIHSKLTVLLGNTPQLYFMHKNLVWTWIILTIVIIHYNTCLFLFIAFKSMVFYNTWWTACHLS